MHMPLAAPSRPGLHGPPPALLGRDRSVIPFTSEAVGRDSGRGQARLGRRRWQSCCSIWGKKPTSLCLGKEKGQRGVIAKNDSIHREGENAKVMLTVRLLTDG
jgi:hypothetical protein